MADQEDTATQELLDTQEDASTVSADSGDNEGSALDINSDGRESGSGQSISVIFAPATIEAMHAPAHEVWQDQHDEERHDAHVNKVHEWSGEVDELPPIVESDDQIDDDEEQVPTSSRSVKIEPKRRSSDTHTKTLSFGRVMGMRRISSMSELLRLKGRLRVPALLSSKASPASPAITVCSIHIFEPEKLNTVYESPSESEGRQTAHTVQSDHGTVQMVWEEPTASASSSVATVLVDDSAGVGPADELEDHTIPPSPRMERVKTKLTVWSWERELGDESDDRPRWLPLMDLSDERRRSVNRMSDHSPISEGPPAPPNTARQSGQSSAKPSQPQTPAPEVSEDSSDDSPPIEIKMRSKSHNTQPTRSSTPDFVAGAPPRRSSVPPSPSIGKNLSSLGTDDIRFRSHRDSVEITHGHIKRHEEEGPINQELLNSRDSFVLTKSKMVARYQYPRPATPTTHRSRLVALRPIPDASPPPSVTVSSAETTDRHPDEHDNCPICDEHRPGWFETKHRKW